MNVMGVKMQDKTALIIGGVGLLAAYWVTKKATDAIGNGLNYAGEAISNTGTALSHPIDNLLAGYLGILPSSVTNSNTEPTVGFSTYIQSYGGIDAYIAAHKNGTWAGRPYDPAQNTSKVIVPHWYDPLNIFGGN